MVRVRVSKQFILTSQKSRGAFLYKAWPQNINRLHYTVGSTSQYKYFTG